MPDLLDIAELPWSESQEFKRQLARRGKPPRTKGYAAPPGSGPVGETCGSCQHIVRHETGARRIFRKCGLTKWTHGAATDIRAASAACSRWEARS